MTDAEKYVAVFKAAARGVMEPYPPPQLAPASVGLVTGRTYDEEGYNHARSMAGAFNAIADVFQTVADAEGE